MTRLVGPDGYVKQTDIKSQSGTVRYKAGKNGLYKVENPTHVAALKAQGFSEETLAKYSPGDTGRGYNCTECGFGSWFRKCSRCGHESAEIKTDGDIEYDNSDNA